MNLLELIKEARSLWLRYSELSNTIETCLTKIMYELGDHPTFHYDFELWSEFDALKDVEEMFGSKPIMKIPTLYGFIAVLEDGKIIYIDYHNWREEEKPPSITILSKNYVEEKCKEVIK